MELEEAINHYLELKPCEKWIESIEPKFFFEFAETLIKYIKEESIPRAIVEELIKEAKERIEDIKNQEYITADEDELIYILEIKIRVLQEILNKGE